MDRPVVLRRRAPGKQGGRPVRRRFWFAPRDGDKYPSESVLIRNNVVETDIKQPSWSWALSKMATEGLWLVIPVHQDREQTDLRTARSSVWRTAHRRGIEVTSEYVKPNLYVAVTE